MIRTTALALLALLSGLLPGWQRPIDPASQRIVDLSHGFGPKTLYWPTSPSKFTLEKLASGQTEGGYFYSANRFCTPEHGGTHLDAPVHFAEQGRDVAGIPLEQLVAQAVVIDVSAQAAKDRDYRLTAQDVWAFDGRLAAASRVHRGCRG